MASLAAIRRTGAGFAQVGSIFPVMSSLTGSHTVPASGVVAKGWMRCDGVAIPAGNALTGNTPDLTGDRFLMGSTSSGSTGGVNTGAATSGAVLTFNKNLMNTNGSNHTHADGSYHAHFVIASVGSPAGFGTSVTVPTWSPSHFFSSTTSSHSGTETASSDVGGTSGGNVPQWSSSTVTISASGGTSGTSIVHPTVTEKRPLFISAVYMIRVN